MVTQGHVSINRFLSTTHGYLGLFRSHGQRLFVDTGEGWRLLGMPSLLAEHLRTAPRIYSHLRTTGERREPVIEILGRWRDLAAECMEFLRREEQRVDGLALRLTAATVAWAEGRRRRVQEAGRVLGALGQRCRRTLQEAGGRLPPLDGAFYLFPRTPLPDDVQFVRLLQDENILTVPGSGFGGPGHFRIAYCVDDRVIDRAAAGFRRAMERARGMRE